MRLIAWVAAAVVAVSIQAAEGAEIRTQLPGTGISIVAPEGFIRSSLGSGFNDIPNHSFIALSAGEGAPGAPSLEDGFKGMYPRPPELLEVDGARGTLYQKVRRSDGGAWDGLTLVLRKNGHVIFANAQYFGTDAKEISKLRSSLLSIRWDGALADAETAFGVRLRFAGLRLVPNSLGTLVYTASGMPAKGVTTATVGTTPVAGGQAGTFADKCKAALIPAFRGQQIEGPHISTIAGKDVCEVWTASRAQPLTYMGVVAMHLDAALLVSGWGGTSDPGDRERTLATLRSGIASLGDVEGSNR